MSENLKNLAIVLCLLLLAAILVAKMHEPSPAEEAERMFEMVDKSPTSTAEDRCRSADVVAQAWLMEGNQEKFDQWKLTKATTCLRLP